jgi:cell division protein ZapA
VSQATEPVSVRILDREYTVGCAPDERDSLQAAAKLLDARMREIRSGNRMAALDRVAVLAALNMAHELKQLQEQSEGHERDLRRALDAMERSMDAALEAGR